MDFWCILDIRWVFHYIIGFLLAVYKMKAKNWDLGIVGTNNCQETFRKTNKNSSSDCCVYGILLNFIFWWSKRKILNLKWEIVLLRNSFYFSIFFSESVILIDWNLSEWRSIVSSFEINNRVYCLLHLPL